VDTTLLLPLLPTAILLIVARAILAYYRNRAVPGSRQKYVLTTWLIPATTLVLLASAALGTIRLNQEEYLGAAFWATFVIESLIRLWSYFNDDNWFNDQLKKFKQGLKNFGRQVQSAFSPKPAPALG